jgi:hypothetical protein
MLPVSNREISNPTQPVDVPLLPTRNVQLGPWHVLLWHGTHHRCTNPIAFSRTSPHHQSPVQSFRQIFRSVHSRSNPGTDPIAHPADGISDTNPTDSSTNGRAYPADGITDTYSNTEPNVVAF